MRNIKSLFLASLCVGLAAPVAAQAPAAPPAAGATIAVGMAVKDTQGGDVGTVTKVEPGFVTLKTDKHEVRLPVASFTPNKGVLLFAMTRDQLNAATEQALAKQAANIAPGAAVSDSSGAPVGTVSAVDPQFVTVKLASGAEVRLPRSGVAGGPNGVVVGSTAAQLQAAAAAAAPATTPPAGTPPTTPPKR
jgi:preprotein translocase subunit YajC